ncbi:MAG TPA: glycine--tRNA ligase subunit beta [Sphingomicrobium sp.]|nr:glycine--tRNA ligase subunit beta [Sphingomicrobium sp.]
MTADFLLELRSEEIPARMQAGARNDLARLFAQELDKAGLAADSIDVFSTPRRLALIARALPLETEARSEEIKGPRTSAPPQALDGFLRKTGLTREQLEDRDGTFFAVIDTPGQPTRDLLGPMIERIVANFPWPKSMRWGAASASTESLRWIRPLHGIVAMLGEEIVPVAIDGIQSGATTLGHRFHHAGPITVGGPGDYAEKLRACRVIVDQEERECTIRDGADQAAKAAGLNLVADEGLVVENAGLTEWPVPLLGRFDPDYLDVPREVIVLTMRSNQKYFACTGEDGGLAPAFVCVANIEAKDGGEAIAEGNARVLAARLADARFFWEQDLKEPLEHQVAKLSGIIFHEKLGTIADKVERVAKLARWLAEEGIVKGAKPDQAERAARLAKADLVTGMVGEFPELQGIIGGYLAAAQGEPKPVADAIRDQYGTPGEPVSAAVALADKLDTICAFFGIGLKPTGSKDPFALRRAAIGSIEIIVSSGLRLPLTLAIRGALANRAAQATSSEAAHKLDSTAPEILDFFADRLKVQQREAGVRHDLIDAVFALGSEDDLVRLLARVRALQDFVETEEGTNLLTAYKRAANILKKEKWEGGKSKAGASADLEPEEAALVKALDAAEPKASAAVEKEDFTAAMAALASLRSPIDAFFDHVTVNDPDAAKRARRLDLLMRFRDAVNRVANFSRIEG